jgi:hypothetical protein
LLASNLGHFTNFPPLGSPDTASWSCIPAFVARIADPTPRSTVAPGSRDKEVNLISTNHTSRFVSRLARPTLDQPGDRVPVLAKYKHRFAACRPASRQAGQQQNRGEDEQHTRSTHDYEVLSDRP